MQSSIYYGEEYKYFIDKGKTKKERRSASTCLLSILEERFESGNHIGKVLIDMGLVDRSDLQRSLKKQKKKASQRKLVKY